MWFCNTAITLVTKCNTCLLAGKRHKLPSVSHAAVWSAFHRIRAGKDIIEEWKKFVSSTVLLSHRKECELALQVILDRKLKKMIQNKARRIQGAIPGQTVRPTLTSTEISGMRYMAGYIAVKLLRKYWKRTKKEELQRKHEIFVKVLKRMKATGQPGEPDSLHEYSTLWSELIDRGEIYHMNDDVFSPIESIEMVVRMTLNIPDMKSYAPGTDIAKKIHDEVLSIQSILLQWENNTGSTIPSKFEEYSLELLTKITDLWSTVWGHSFAKGWTMNFESKYKRNH